MSDTENTKEVEVSEAETMRQKLVSDVMGVMQPGITASVIGMVDFVQDRVLLGKIELLDNLIKTMEKVMEAPEPKGFQGSEQAGYRRVHVLVSEMYDNLRAEMDARIEELQGSHPHAEGPDHVHSFGCFADPKLQGPLWWVLIDERDGWEGGWQTKEEALRVCQEEFQDLDEVYMSQFHTNQLSDHPEDDYKIKFLVEPFRVQFVDDMGVPLVAPKETHLPKKVMS